MRMRRTVGLPLSVTSIPLKALAMMSLSSKVPSPCSYLREALPDHGRGERLEPQLAPVGVLTGGELARASGSWSRRSGTLT